MVAPRIFVQEEINARKEKTIYVYNMAISFGFKSPAGITALTGIQQKKCKDQISSSPEAPTLIYMITVFKIYII